jgi:hypothetical protein
VKVESNNAKLLGEGGGIMEAATRFMSLTIKFWEIVYKVRV